jgi:hypothetical protein
VNALLAARKVVTPGAAAVFDAAAAGGSAVAGNVVSAPLGTLAVDDTGTLSFNLKYRAFNLGADSNLREWIIRNGVNDLAQNTSTDFSAPADWSGGGNTGGNGNYLKANGQEKLLQE